MHNDTDAPLGEFEVIVLMAALHLGKEAYGSAILDEIETRTGRRVSRGSVYITLDRLEDKKLLESIREYGLVSTEQVKFQFYPSVGRARKRLTMRPCGAGLHAARMASFSKRLSLRLAA